MNTRQMFTTAKAAMITALLVGVAFSLPVSGGPKGETIRLSEPVATTATHEIFGSPLPEGQDSHSLAELMADVDRYEGKEVLVNTNVSKVCRKKGCFFIAQEGDVVARVSFKDYGFFVPTDSLGKQVSLFGTFSRQQLSEEQTAHLASDLGEQRPNGHTPFEYHIVATSVSIPKS